jgi:ACS family tartrate transporter-like MFS transporter
MPPANFEPAPMTIGPTTNSSPSLAVRTRWRVMVRLIPWLFFLYIIAYLDRVNVSVAKLGMELPRDEGGLTGGLGFSNKVIGYGAGIFFWGYWLLEIPSTLSVLRWGARWVFVRILVLWGLCCTLTGAIGTELGDSLFGWMPLVHENPHVSQFYILRFLLGFFEGGFFPSVILYLTLWFRPEDRAKAIATFMAAIPLSQAFGSPLSGLILEYIHWGGIQGWRWIFILQGVAPILAGLATPFLLPDRPEQAAWLPTEERAWLLGELAREEQTRQQRQGHFAWLNQAGIVLLLTIFYFGMNVSSYGLSNFLPAIVKHQTGLSDWNCTLLTGLAHFLAFLAMLFNGWHSDRHQERIWHCALPLACQSAALFLAALTHDVAVWGVIVLICVVGPFMQAHLPAFWPIPSLFLGSTAAASAIGFINMFGNLGGFCGPAMVGEVADGPASFGGALLRLAPFPLLSVCCILIVGWLRRHSLKPKMGGGDS